MALTTRDDLVVARESFFVGNNVLVKGGDVWAAGDRVVLARPQAFRPLTVSESDPEPEPKPTIAKRAAAAVRKATPTPKPAAAKPKAEEPPPAEPARAALKWPAYDSGKSES
jgi:hypothetical protein